MLKSFYINLDGSVERERHIEAQIKQYEFSISRFPGIHYNNLTAAFDLMTRRYRAKLTKGELGCYASHFELATQLNSDQNAEAYLILEDDIEFDASLMSEIEKVIELAPKNWDRIHLSGTPKFSMRSIANLSSRDLVMYSKIPTNAAAYLLNKSGARKITKFRNIKNAVDVDFQRPEQFDLITYGVFPPLVKQIGKFPSTIDNLGKRKGSLGQKILRDLPNEAIYHQYWLIRNIGLLNFVFFQIFDFVISLNKNLLKKRILFLLENGSKIKKINL